MLVLKKIWLLIESFFGLFVSMLMLLMILLGFVQVFLRIFLGDSPTWIIEAIGIMFVWSMIIASGLGVKEGIHLGVDIISAMFPPTIKKFVDIFSTICMLVFGVVLFYVGCQMVLTNLDNLTPVMRITNAYVYLAFVIGGFVFTVNCIILLIAGIQRAIERGNDTNVTSAVN